MRKQNRPKPKKKPLQKESNKSTESNSDVMRLNKYVANAGVCSRREADTLIEAGKIKVNGKAITEMGSKVSYDDVVEFEGRVLKPEKHVYVLLNKPKDFVTTVKDPENRKTVMELVGNATKERIYPVGRLDKNTTGLLLLTNDGDLAKKLTHPSSEINKIYHVFLDLKAKSEDLEKLLTGFTLEDGFIKVDEATFIEGRNPTEIGLQLHSGRNRIIRRMMEHLGFKVLKLDRVMFATLTKKDLPRGKWRHLTTSEIGMLKRLTKGK